MLDFINWRFIISHNRHCGKQIRQSIPFLLYRDIKSLRHIIPVFQGARKDNLFPTDEKDGFIHASKDPQMLLGMVNHFYKLRARVFPS